MHGFSPINDGRHSFSCDDRPPHHLEATAPPLGRPLRRLEAAIARRWSTGAFGALKMETGRHGSGWWR